MVSSNADLDERLISIADTDAHAVMDDLRSQSSRVATGLHDVGFSGSSHLSRLDVNASSTGDLCDRLFGMARNQSAGPPGSSAPTVMVS
jgi:hypothetical protein